MAAGAKYDVELNFLVSRQSRSAGSEFAKDIARMERDVGRKKARPDSKGGIWTATGKGAGGALDVFSKMGTGSAAAWAGKASAVIGGILSAGIAVAVTKGMFGGLAANAKAEEVRGRIGSTLQLFDFAADAGSAEQQFAQNLQTAKAYQGELVKIADAAPGDVEQVTDLFQNMLPGLASVTQEHTRIRDLTQKEVYLAGILGNRFALVGEQTSRILTGGAGAEMDTWRLLQKPIAEAGRELGAFPKKSQLFGEKLTMAFNKLSPEQRLATFEKALERLSKPIRDYYENTWEGITAQGTSALKELRRSFGQEGFYAVKRAVKSLTGEGGVLNQGSERFQSLRTFMVGMGQQFGRLLEAGILKVGAGLAYVADNWATIVQRAQIAAQWLADGAKTAAGLMGAKAGGAFLAQGAGAAMQAVTSVLSMGAAALIAAPAFIALGVVVGGAAVMFGGVITYLTSNIDDFAGALAQIDLSEFVQAVSDLGAKFYALGSFLLGDPADAQTGLQVAVGLATNAVVGVTNAFSWLLEATAWVIGAFGDVAEFAHKLNPFNGPTKEMMDIQTELAERSKVSGFLNDPEYLALSDKLDALEQAAGMRDESTALNMANGAREAAADIRAAALRFDLAVGDPTKPASEIAEMLTPMGPELPPGFKPKNQKPPPVNVKVNNYNSWNIRDADPNAIVAAFNKTTARQVANPIRTAMQRRQGV